MKSLRLSTNVIVPLLVVLVARFVYYHTTEKSTFDAWHKEMDPKLVPQEEWINLTDHVTLLSMVYTTSTKSSTDNNTLVLFIPGNPGIPFFYLPLLQEIVQRDNLKNEIRCLSHASQANPWDQPEDHSSEEKDVFSFEDHINHKIEYVRQRIQANPDLNFILIGHSIGTYFILEILKEFPEKVKKIALIQPTIMQMEDSFAGKILGPLLGQYEILSKIIHLIDVLVPKHLRDVIVHLATGFHLEEVLIYAANAMIDHSVAFSAMKMAHEEILHVKDFKHEEVIKEHEHKIMFLLSEWDEWVPEEVPKMFEDTFQGAEHRRVQEPHAFMMVKNGSESIANHVWEWIQDEL